jgi:hypothetical protein
VTQSAFFFSSSLDFLLQSSSILAFVSESASDSMKTVLGAVMISFALFLGAGGGSSFGSAGGASLEPRGPRVPQPALPQASPAVAPVPLHHSHDRDQCRIQRADAY